MSQERHHLPIPNARPNLPPLPLSIAVSVESEAQVMEACRRARQLAEQAGFPQVAAYHVATAASELASNLLRHAGSGKFTATLQKNPVGIVLCAEDHGPGIADLARALEDGFSTQGGLGCGLPGVKRLMDEFTILSTPGIGTRVAATKWLTRPAQPSHGVGRALRATTGQQYCGDQLGCWWHAERLTLAIADGLGHGKEAHQAAVLAMNHIDAFVTQARDPALTPPMNAVTADRSATPSWAESWRSRERRQPSWRAHPGGLGQDEAATRQNLHTLFTQLDHSLRDTRGIALTVVTVIPATGHLVHAAVGNVRARIEGQEGTRRLGCARGIVGAGYQGLRAECFDLNHGDWVILFSDGLEENIGFPELARQESPSDKLCMELLEHYARSDDDAALLLYRYPLQAS